MAVWDIAFGETVSGGIYWMPTAPGTYTIDSLILSLREYSFRRKAKYSDNGGLVS